jgi:hypothetical protein
VKGVLNSTLLTKLKNQELEKIAKDKEYTVTNHPELPKELVDMMYDRQRGAIVDFYYKLIAHL